LNKSSLTRLVDINQNK